MYHKKDNNVDHKANSSSGSQLSKDGLNNYLTANGSITSSIIPQTNIKGLIMHQTVSGIQISCSNRLFTFLGKRTS